MYAVRGGTLIVYKPSGAGGNVLMLELDPLPHPVRDGSRGAGASAQRATRWAVEAQRRRRAAAHALPLMAND